MITAAAQNPCGSRAKDLDVSQAVADFRFGRRGSAHDLFQNVDDADRPMEDGPSVAFSTLSRLFGATAFLGARVMDKSLPVRGEGVVIS